MTGDEFDSELDVEMDSILRRGGAQLRDEANAIDGNRVMIGSLKRQVHSASRMNTALASVAVILAVALIAAVAAIVRDRGAVTESPKHVGGSTPAAVKLVDSLPPQPVDPHKVKLVASVARYDTCASLVDKLHRVGAEHVGSRGFGQYGYATPIGGYYGAGLGYQRRFSGSANETAIAFSSSADSAGGAATGETLGTNVIVEGVDEPDTVKATGSLVVDLTGTKLRVTDTRSASVLSTLELGQEPSPGQDTDATPDPNPTYSNPVSLLVEGNRVLVFGVESVPRPALPDDPSAARPYDVYVTLTFVDLADPAQPTVLDRARIEGSLVAARRVGDQVRIVTNSDLAELPMVVPTGGDSVAAALRQNRLAVAESAAQDWLPDWDHGESTQSKRLVDCANVVVPDTFAGVQMTSLVQFDLDGPFEPQAMSILAPSENLTANATDVVVASHVWVDPAEQKGDYSDWSTALHRFEFGEGGPTYLASGSVPGSVRDEFSLSVLDDRTIGVVTVDQVPWKDRDKAKVTVRTLSDTSDLSKLVEVGSLEPSGSGESIGGVRFIGDRLLVSSGPLATVLSAVDLSDPANLKDLGSVGTGGVGEYIHPLPDNRVLVIGSTYITHGKDVRSAIQVLLVDLNGAPAISATWVKESASTSVGYDHHGFTWWPQHSIAAFGIYNHSTGSLATPPPTAALLNIGADSISPTIVTPRDADLGPKCKWDEPVTDDCDSSGDPSVQRVLVIDGQPWLYTTESLEHLDPQSFNSLALVPLPPAM
ncbi:MAG: beta-propeller domain-containing protein [Microthrixaceae bacterium]|nr:beta-propeller domain-containing protein [Microthrixaceae bacterium]